MLNITMYFFLLAPTKEILLFSVFCVLLSFTKFMNTDIRGHEWDVCNHQLEVLLTDFIRVLWLVDFVDHILQYGPPNLIYVSERYNKHLINLVFSVRTL